MEQAVSYWDTCTDEWVGFHSAVGSTSDYRSRGWGLCHITFVEIVHEINSCSHSDMTDDSRRAVVSYCGHWLPLLLIQEGQLSVTVAILLLLLIQEGQLSVTVTILPLLLIQEGQLSVTVTILPLLLIQEGQLSVTVTILPLLLIQEGQLSVTDKSMCPSTYWLTAKMTKLAEEQCE